MKRFTPPEAWEARAPFLPARRREKARAPSRPRGGKRNSHDRGDVVTERPRDGAKCHNAASSNVKVDRKIRRQKDALASALSRTNTRVSAIVSSCFFSPFCVRRNREPAFGETSEAHEDRSQYFDSLARVLD